MFGFDEISSLYW